MKLEKFKEKNNKKKGIIVFSISCVLLIIGVFFHQSFALFETKENFNLIEGQVQESGDLYFAYYVNDEISLDVPTKDSGLTLSSKSSCTNGVTILWDNEKWEARLSYANYQKERTGRVKCSLYFEKPVDTTNMMIAMKRGTLTTDVSPEEPSYTDPPPNEFGINATYTQKGKYFLDKVIFETVKSPIDGALEVVDFSVNQDGSVLGYYVEDEFSPGTTLHIQADGKIKMNTNGSYYFAPGDGTYTFEGIENIDTSETTNMAYMFFGTGSLKSLDLSHFDTSKVTDMSGMFYGRSLTSLDISNFDTSNVTNMKGMFYFASGLTNLDLSSFNTSNVTNMSYMFHYASDLTNLDLSSFDTSNVTDMSRMFDGCDSLTTLDVSQFNTSKVTDMALMFDSMSNLTSLDVSHFDTSNVTNMESMFKGMSNLSSLDISGFNTSNVTNMGYMFWGMSGLTELNLSSFDTSNVANMEAMFCNDTKLDSIIYGEKFIYRSDIEVVGMFYNCPANKPTHESWSSVTW